MQKLFSLIIFVCAVLLDLSCTKGETESKPDQLTVCPENADCSYRYYNNMQRSAVKLTAAETRLFVTENALYGTTTRLDIAAPATDHFSLAGSDMLLAVTHSVICTNCLVVHMKPAGGYVKGQKLSGNRWLIDAEIRLQGEGNPVSDTVRLKQIFLPAN